MRLAVNQDVVGSIPTLGANTYVTIMSIRPDKRGTLNHNSKLDLAKVRYILGSALSNAALARELGVSRAAVSNVRTGRTWSWVDADWDNEDDGLEFEVAA